MSVHDEYVKVFRERIGIGTWIPAWRPGADIRLGDVGRIEDGEFARMYHLSDRGIPDDVLKASDPDMDPDDYDGASKDAVSVSVKAAGKTDAAFEGVAQANVGVKLRLRREVPRARR